MPDLTIFFNVVAATDSAPPADVELDDAGRAAARPRGDRRAPTSRPRRRMPEGTVTSPPAAVTPDFSSSRQGYLRPGARRARRPLGLARPRRRRRRGHRSSTSRAPGSSPPRGSRQPSSPAWSAAPRPTGRLAQPRHRRDRRHRRRRQRLRSHRASLRRRTSARSSPSGASEPPRRSARRPTALGPGDVMLLEMHRPGPRTTTRPRRPAGLHRHRVVAGRLRGHPVRDRRAASSSWRPPATAPRTSTTRSTTRRPAGFPATWRNPFRRANRGLRRDHRRRGRPAARARTAATTARTARASRSPTTARASTPRAGGAR